MKQHSNVSSSVPVIQSFNRLVSLPNVPSTLDILHLASETNGVFYELVVQLMYRVLVIVSYDLDPNVRSKVK